MNQPGHQPTQEPEGSPKSGDEREEDLVNDKALRENPRATSHPTGADQAAENIENDTVA